jgi:hypothetical protein
LSYSRKKPDVQDESRVGENAKDSIWIKGQKGGRWQRGG